MPEQGSDQEQDGRLDPLFLHSRREAIIIFSVWLLALLWAVPYCYFGGYAVAESDQLQTVWGIPSWVFWGIAAPWLLADVFTVWFCLSYMEDDDVTSGAKSADPAGDAAIGSPA